MAVGIMAIAEEHYLPLYCGSYPDCGPSEYPRFSLFFSQGNKSFHLVPFVAVYPNK